MTRQDKSPMEKGNAALLHAVDAMTTLCDWFAQREAGKPTTNSEAAMFARCDQALSYLEAALGLSPEHPQ